MNIIDAKKTDTITAKYALLPQIDLSLRFLVEVTEPIGLCAFEHKISAVMSMIKSPTDVLKEHLLAQWHEMYKDHKRVMKKAGVEWVYDVKNVNLIECDLLVPKKQ